MKAILDENLPPRVAQALHLLVEPDGHAVRHLREYFGKGVPDQSWMATLGNEGGWVVISRDGRILKNRLEREAFRRSKLILFVLASGWARLTFPEVAAKLLLRWPKIADQTALVSGGAAFELPVKPGSKLRQLRA